MKTTTILLSGSNLFWLSKTQNLVESQLVFSIRRHNRNNYRNSSNSRNSYGVIISRRLETFGALTNSSRQKTLKAVVGRSIDPTRKTNTRQTIWLSWQANKLSQTKTKTCSVDCQSVAIKMMMTAHFKLFRRRRRRIEFVETFSRTYLGR